jgi:UDP-N-acetylglucosamine 2-epimerase (non-hydrolysing)
MAAEFGFDFNGIRAIEPRGFLEFLQLEANARLVLTDSGGVQEETCILGVPCVTLRENTERPETVDVGANVLAGVTYEWIMNGAKKMLETDTRWKNPFGDGHTGDRIVKIVGN